MRAHVADECKNDYAAQLQKYNKEQNQFYFSDMPLIFNVSQLSIAKWQPTTIIILGFSRNSTGNTCISYYESMRN